MKRALSIWLIILLASAIWSSCRSSRQVAVHECVTDSASVEQAHESLVTDEVLSAIVASGEVNLEDITVEFFPPDSAHPDARAAPCKISVGRAHANRTSRQVSKTNTLAVEKDTSTFTTSHNAATLNESKVEQKVSTPLRVALLPTITGIVIILIIIILYRRFRNENLQ